MITYPITLPVRPVSRGVKTVTFRPMSAVATQASAWSYAEQSQVWPGQKWMVDVQYPPMKGLQAEAMVAALTSLNGPEGSFLFGDPANLVPRGAGALSASPIVSSTILNGGFETLGAGGADVFANWIETIGGSGGALVDGGAGSAHSGSHCCNFAQNVGVGVNCTLVQNILTVGKNYGYSFWVKKGSSGALQVDLQNNGSSVRTTSGLTTSYQQFSGTFIALATDLTFLLQCSGIGSQLFLDDISITDLGPLVNGGSQTGYDLLTKGWATNLSNILRAGDWIQLGTGSTARLYKNMVDASSDGSGHATLTLWPMLRSSPSDNALITLNNASSRFRLTQNVPWSIDEAMIYGLQFSAVEDLRP
jgi:hypothetical protein